METCQHCGTILMPVVWPATTTKYCSRVCNNAAYYQRHRRRLQAKSREASRVRWKERRRDRRKWNNSAHGKAIRKAWQVAHKVEVYQRFLDRGGLALVRTRAASRKRLLQSTRPRRCVLRTEHAGRLECHHRDGNPFNTALKNLEWRCAKHHRAAHRRPAPPLSKPAVPGSSPRRTAQAHTGE